MSGPPPPPADIPAFAVLPVAEIPATVAKIRAGYCSRKTRDLSFRITQLRKLYWAVEDYTPLLIAALHKDLRMSAFEVHLGELDMTKNLILNMLKNIETYTADEKIEGLPPVALPMHVRVRKEPLGVALIISPYNFPVQLSLGPAIGAIAAGCAFVLKPSEATPAASAVLAHMLAARLDTSVYTVVNGAVDETTALLEQKWDKIFYTGGGAVARIIAKKAAETLTPVSLELGGINPAFITPSANVQLAARRLMWGKSFNCGQVCLSQNYALVDRAKLPQFIEELHRQYAIMFPNGAKASADYSRIINKRHFDRISGYIKQTKGKVVMGGETDETTLYIEPTVVLVEDEDDVLLTNETFGPVWAVMAVDSVDEAIEIANRVCATPLGLYPFGNKTDTEKILSRVTSGGATVNDGYMHGSIDAIPFGGVGESGMGASHGRAGFDAFTHRRSVVVNPPWTDKLLRVRYMPYDWAALRQLKFISMRPNFDRNAREVRGLAYWLGVVVRLGGKSVWSAAGRWIVAGVAVAVATGRTGLEWASGVLRR
ncbi:hypothetical protein TD95_004208 [Thielaviopsis punctulata]|uniref:Aldehyde dehydrogenase n=1 Tax=Thielaviopsis punctulata TaxID=72032 RepID=A0A0F4ZLE6_9PEZI|nr:hypothetical protein TD95_004208 [Thielaviopsis punctulata]